MSFILNKIYKDNLGNSYTYLKREGDFGIFKFNMITKKFKIIQYCGVEAVMQYGKILFKSDKIIPTFDSELDIEKPQIKTESLKLNNNNERYINVLLSHIKGK